MNLETNNDDDVKRIEVVFPPMPGPDEVDDYTMPDDFDPAVVAEQLALDAIKNNPKREKAFRHEPIAKALMKERFICRISGQLAVWTGQVYSYDQRLIESFLIDMRGSIKKNQRAEVVSYLDIKAPKKEVADAKFIAFNNGVLDIETGAILDFNPDIAITNLIPHDYKPNVYSEVCDKLLDRLACGRADVRALMEEVVGYCFYRRAEMAKAVFFKGEKSNGKSTYIELIRRVLGDENLSALDLSELSKTFSTATLAGKLANLGDDISSEYLDGSATAFFKKVSAGNMIAAEKKYEAPFMFKPTVKLIFSANDIPRMKDRSGAASRRMLIVPFDATFSESDPDYDPYLVHKLKTEEVMTYLCRIGVEGLKRIIHHGKFTECAEVAAALKEYNDDSDPVIQFVNSVGGTLRGVVGRLAQDLFADYTAFCARFRYQALSYTAFVKGVNRYCNTECKRLRDEDGERAKYFTPKPTHSNPSLFPSNSPNNTPLSLSVPLTDTSGTSGTQVGHDNYI